MFDYVTLKVIWWGIITFLVIAFAITGGIDIGVNFLLPIVGRRDTDRRLILNSIGPTWEGNQVWLITLAAALFAIWPDAYAAAFSSLYLALMLVVLMLILRPPGFDYRGKIDSHAWRVSWDLCLFVGSMVLAIIFGVAVGNLYVGLPFHFNADLLPIYTGDFLDLLSPVALLFGLVSLCMFAVQGSLFLQYKLDGWLQKNATRAVEIFGIGFMISFVGAGIYVSLWVRGYSITSIPDLNTGFAVTQKTVDMVYSGWLTNYSAHHLLWLFPVLAVISTRVAMRLSHKELPLWGLLVNSFGIACTVLTASAALFPFILPSVAVPNHSLTIWDACSSYLTLKWALLAVVVLLPIILLYTAWVYSVMRGKVKLYRDSY